MIRIERIKVNDLYEFACRLPTQPSSQDIIPTVKHRALAQTHNPYANENDIGLLVAYMGDRCIGYLGVMPGLLKVNNQFSKIYWFSTFFISPELRGKGLGIELVKSAFSLGYDFAASPVSKTRSERVFKYSGMKELGELEYYAADLRILNIFSLPLRLLREALRKLRIELLLLNEIIRIIDRLCLPPIKYIFYNLLLGKTKPIENITVKETDKIEPGDILQASDNSASAEFYRDQRIINWMLEYKWTKDKCQAEPQDFNYLFSDLRDYFKFIALKIYSKESRDYLGFLILSLSFKGGHSILKVLDFSARDYEQIAFLALKFARIYKAGCVEFPDIFWPHLKSNLILRLITLKKKFTYLFYAKDKDAPLACACQEIKLKYCDGDNAFF